LIGDGLRWAVRVLAQAGVDSPRLDAELLMAHAIASSRAALYTRWYEALAPSDVDLFTNLVRRRVRREPLAYITGTRAFYDIDISVAPGVLIPRPETERIVEETLSWCQTLGLRAPRIADVGTGSGALAIVLARHLPRARIVASDLSAEALTAALRNVAHYGLEDRVDLVRADLLGALSGPFDVIVANLPYVPQDRLDSLAPEVRDHEPRLALDGGPDGLDVIRRLVPQVADRLRRPGLLLLEIDNGQADTALQLVRDQLPHSQVETLRDLAGLERIVRAEIRCDALEG